ncbi:MAG: enoyl-CoA hydratase/isomerase family protein [Planctomycetes bacterium]|nr:enoyl-CoA hydratase/isomerase family protein [Planctomycetota bacterium]
MTSADRDFGVEVESLGSLRLVRLAHGKANAIDVEFCRGLTKTLKELAATDAVRAIVLTGRGRIFSAGVDLVRLTEESTDYLFDFLPPLEEMFEACITLPCPLVAAINGHSIAGGGVLACAADYRVLAETAKVGVPELQVGVPFPPFAMEIVRASVPAPRFREIVIRGQLVQGAEAVSSGFADEVLPAPQVEARAIEVATELATIPAPAYRLFKVDWRRPLIARARSASFDDVAAGWRHPSVREAVTRYVERTLSR